MYQGMCFFKQFYVRMTCVKFRCCMMLAYQHFIMASSILCKEVFRIVLVNVPYDYI